ncbi:NAD(P)-binding protein [Xylaria telfairii]|nr:NAD(P)-binding protein [Xylaria telfairii]
MTKIFLTGASGYIGGDVLHLLYQTHPEYIYKVLCRDAAKASQISSAYSNVHVVQGSLDDTDIIRRESSDADVVLNLAATSHMKSVETIHKALADSKRQTPSFWVQVSGATAIAAAELADRQRTPGSGSSVIFDDLNGIEDIRSMIQEHPSRAVDNYVLKVAAGAANIKTALVFPPIIYGVGRGPINQRSIQIPFLVKATIERKRGLQVGKGLSRWGNVHIRDLSELFLKLVERAAGGKAEGQIWGTNGLYLTGIGEMSFAEISKETAAAAVKQGLIPNDDVEELNGAEADSSLPHGNVLYGTNARSKALRGKELLGWAPHHESLSEAIPDAVKTEAQRLSSQ